MLVDEVAFEFFGGDFGFEVVGLLLLLVELAFEAFSFGVGGLCGEGDVGGLVDEGFEAATEGGERFLGEVLVLVEGEGEDVDDFFLVFDDGWVEGLFFEVFEEVLEGGIEGVVLVWGKGGGFGVFVQAGSDAEFFGVEAAKVGVDGECSYKVSCA